MEEESAWMQGIRAYDSYESRDSNPYTIDQFEYFDWNRGYNDRKNGYVDEYGYFGDEDD